RPQRPVAKNIAVPLGLVGLALTLTAAVTSLYTLWNDPTVAKDNVRELVRYIEDRAGTNDLVVYNDAILMLSHEHYMERDDLPVVPLPYYPYVATGGTIDNLNRFQGEYERIWYVPSPPDDGRDETRMVHTWLLENGQVIDEQAYDGKATMVRVEAFQTQFASLSAATESQIQLKNIELASIGPNRIWINTQWSGDLRQLPPDTEAIIELKGADDWNWVRHQSPVLHTVDQSERGAVSQIQLDFPRPLGLNGGSYQLRVDLVLKDGSPLAQTEGGSTNLDLPSYLARELIVSTSPTARFENGVALKAVEIPDLQIRPGHFLPTHVVWQTENNIDVSNLSYKLQIFGPDGRLVADQSGNPATDWVNAWSPDQLYRDHTEALFPADAQPGIYEFRWQLLEGDTVVPGRQGWWPFGSDWVTLGSVEVVPWPFVDTAPAVDVPLDATFDTIGRLHGYTQTETQDRLTVEMVWQVEQVPAEFYVSFLHLIDPATGDIVAQRAWIPADGLRPTTGWRPGEFISDTHSLDLAELPAGTYDIALGLYVPNTFQRPAVTLNGAEQVAREVVIGRLKK
ncbi:MAG: hypothetical protein AAF902_08665, partial [Chloroflexota bacterium]